MSVFTEKNETRRDGKARTDRKSYREARSLRRAVGGAFGRQSKQFWKAAAIGTVGETKAGGVGDTTPA